MLIFASFALVPIWFYDLSSAIQPPEPFAWFAGCFFPSSFLARLASRSFCHQKFLTTKDRLFSYSHIHCGLAASPKPPLSTGSIWLIRIIEGVRTLLCSLTVSSSYVRSTDPGSFTDVFQLRRSLRHLHPGNEIASIRSFFLGLAARSSFLFPPLTFPRERVTNAFPCKVCTNPSNFFSLPSALIEPGHPSPHRFSALHLGASGLIPQEPFSSCRISPSRRNLLVHKLKSGFGPFIAGGSLIILEPLFFPLRVVVVVALVFSPSPFTEAEPEVFNPSTFFCLLIRL